jgi:mono/diheme cytochrome c family protein
VVLVAAGVATSVVACGGSSASSQGGPTSTGGATSTSAAATTQSSSSATATHSSATGTHSSTTSAHSSTTSAQASSEAGLKVFTSAGCGSCHTLAAAHASGDVGPNLDDLKPSEAEVASQVTSGGGAMPSYAGKLSAAQIEAVAKFVATAAK